MAARSIGTALISFGLVSIPVKLFSTGEPSHELHFHMIHAGCGRRVHQELVCPEHGTVSRDRIAKGYEPSRGHLIELAPSELEALDAVASEAIDIREFVPAAAVDPLFVEHSYYLGPGKGGARPYRLLHDALARAELVAIGAYAARGKSYIVMIRPYEDGLAMHQLRYADEVRPLSAVEHETGARPSKQELELASALIEKLEHDAFDPSKYHDDVKARVKKLLAEKEKSGEVIEAEEPAAAPPKVTDLLAALRASIEAGEQGEQGAKHAGDARRAAAGGRRRSRATHHRHGKRAAAARRRS